MCKSLSMFRLSLPHQSFCHCVTFRFAADLKKSLITQTIMSALQQLDFYDEAAASYSIQKNILSNNGRKTNQAVSRKPSYRCCDVFWRLFAKYQKRHFRLVKFMIYLKWFYGWYRRTIKCHSHEKKNILNIALVYRDIVCHKIYIKLSWSFVLEWKRHSNP